MTEAVDYPKRECRNSKEVEGGYHFAMVVQECQPALGLALVPSAIELLEISRDSRFGNHEAELKQLTMDARCTQVGFSTCIRRIS